jgi:hypothetical protein
MQSSQHHPKPRTSRWLLVVAAVVVTHVVLFAFAGRVRPLPHVPYIAPPNFVARERAVENTKTGERTVYREFTVSTKMERRP